MKITVSISLLLFPMLILTGNAMAAETDKETSALFPLDAKYRFTFDSVDMPVPDDRMGLVGFHYLVDVNPNFHVGLGGFGSVSGDRGGFLTAGFTGGLQKQLIGNLWFDGGLFLGGGGGGGAPQGNGLMVRPYAGLLYDFDILRLGLSYSRVHFPKTEIDSENLAVSIDLPFTNFVASGNPGRVEDALSRFTPRASAGFMHQEILFSLRSNYPHSSVKNTGGVKTDNRLDLVGVQFRHFLNPHSYLMAEVMGAFGGDADGYAEVLAGGGYRFALNHEKFNLNLGLALGSGGGGGIDTGGGAIIHTTAGLEYQLSTTFLAGLYGGYIDSFDGSFRATTVGVRLGFAMENLGSGFGNKPRQSDDTMQWNNWRIRFSHLTYTDPERKAAVVVDETVRLVGIKADYFLNESFYLTGQAAGAYDGKAGGYAVGLVGIGLQSASWGNSGLRFTGELLAGVAGGGGIAVDDGIIIQPMLGIEYAFDDRFSIQILAGQVDAVDGDLSTPVVDVALTWRFSTLGREIK